MDSPQVNQPTDRLLSIDFLRGFVIVLMTVDHVRDMFHSVSIGALIDQNVSLGLYFTRWATHICAPVFVFLAGLSAYLRFQKGDITRGQLQIFLIKRGLFLILLEFAIVNALFNVIFGYPVYMLSAQVIWTIGVCMLFLSLLLFFPWKIIFFISLFFILTNNLFDSFTSTNSALWNFLHVRAKMQITEGLLIRSSYPLYPWPGIIGIGYCFGVMLWRKGVSPIVRQKWLLITGLSGLSAFCILRMIGSYGDPEKFVSFVSVSESLKSLLNTTKYPPSLQFILMTIPIGLLILAATENLKTKPIRLIANYGSTPLFYYVAHLCTIPLVNFSLALIFGEKRFVSDSLFVTWLVSIGIVVILYKPVSWFKSFRARYRHKIPVLNYI